MAVGLRQLNNFITDDSANYFQIFWGRKIEKYWNRELFLMAHGRISDFHYKIIMAKRIHSNNVIGIFIANLKKKKKSDQIQS